MKWNKIEKKPDKHTNVLILVKDGENIEIQPAYYYVNNFYDYYHIYEEYYKFENYITHWMEFPNLPEEYEKENTKKEVDKDQR